MLRLSLEKAEEVARRTPAALVMAADTTVVIDGDVLGKPDDGEAATAMLRRLRNRTHVVVTGLTAMDSATGAWRSSAKCTQVTMRRYSDDEIQRYVSAGEPLDKAGGYAVQDPGFRPARMVDGCYLNVVGLPLCEAVSLQQQMGEAASLRPQWAPPSECRDCLLSQRGEAPKP